MRQYSPHWFDKPTVALWTALESPKLESQQVKRFMDRDSLLKKDWGTISSVFSLGSRKWTASTEIQLILSLI